VFALVGRLLIYLWQKFPLSSYLSKKWKLLEQLFECDLCLGVWAYTILAFLFGVNIFEGWFYVVIISEFLTGAITSFLVHLVRIGWDTRFRVIQVN